MQDLSRIIARNSAFGLAAQLAIKVLSFGFSVLIVRQLRAESFGQYAGVLAFGAMFVFLSDLGLGAYALREVARFRAAPNGVERSSALFSSVLPLRLLLSILAAGLAVYAAWLTGRPLVMVVAIALGGVGLIMYAVQGTSETILTGFERMDLAASAKVLNQLTFVVAGGLALWWGLGYYGLILASLLGVALMTWVCWRAVRGLGVSLHRPVVSTWPSLLRAAVPVGIGGFAIGLSYKFDSLLLSIFRGDIETGYYAAVYNLIFSVAIISNVFNTALFPSLARQVATEPQVLPRVCGRALRYLLVLGLPIAAGGFVAADQLVPFLFTSAYAPAVLVLQILIWVVPLMFLSEFLGYVVFIQGLEQRSARALLVSTGLNVVLNSLLVPRYGLVAAAVMTVITEAVLVGQYVWILRALLRQVDWALALGRPLAAALAMAGLVFALGDLPFLAKVGVGALSYGGLLLVLRVLGADEIAFVRGLRRPAPSSQSVVATPFPEPMDAPAVTPG